MRRARFDLRLLLSGLAGCILFLFYGAVFADAGQPRAWEHLLMPAPPFHLMDENGELHRDDFKGKVTVINFWATWCGPCRKELPSMNRAWAILGNEGVEMLAINVGENREAVTAFKQDYPIEFPVLLDSMGNISQRWEVSGLPTTFIVNPEGNIAYRVVGAREWDADEMLNLVRRLEPPQKLGHETGADTGVGRQGKKPE